jgi:hypothetical protein
MKIHANIHGYMVYEISNGTIFVNDGTKCTLVTKSLRKAMNDLYRTLTYCNLPFEKQPIAKIKK